MSKEYDNYIYEHRNNVACAFQWIKNNVPFLDQDAVLRAEANIRNHDQSKDSPEEYSAYDAYFYGREKTDKVKNDFDYAWLHHQHLNPHHWQHWLLVNDDPGSKSKVLEMPPEYIYEMIADWWSFSLKNEKPFEIFDWYNKHLDTIVLGVETEKIVNDILNKMKEILIANIDEDAMDDMRNNNG